MLVGIASFCYPRFHSIIRCSSKFPRPIFMLGKTGFGSQRQKRYDQ